MKASALQRVLAYQRRLGFRHGLAIALHRFMGNWLNPGVTYVYGTLGEEAIINYLLTERLNIRTPGFYVDVGCSHPIFHSNTWLLYQQGWHGLAIDANDALIREYSMVRPRDRAVCALVSNRTAERVFHISSNYFLSSIDARLVATGPRESVSKVRMAAVTLSELLDKHDVPKVFEFLKVDVEGHDYEVLCSLDFGRYRPILVMAEVRAKGCRGAIATPLNRHLSRQGYVLDSFFGYNAIFLDATRMSR